MTYCIVCHSQTFVIPNFPLLLSSYYRPSVPGIVWIKLILRIMFVRSMLQRLQDYDFFLRDIAGWGIELIIMIDQIKQNIKDQGGLENKTLAKWMSSGSMMSFVKKKLFYGRPDGPANIIGSVGRSGDFFNFCFQKMTPKTRKFRENFNICCRKILGKYLDLFSRIFSQIF